MTESLRFGAPVPNEAERELDWVVTKFVDDAPGAAHAVLVSADGLLMAAEAGACRLETWKTSPKAL